MFFALVQSVGMFIPASAAFKLSGTSQAPSRRSMGKLGTIGVEVLNRSQWGEAKKVE